MFPKRVGWHTAAVMLLVAVARSAASSSEVTGCVRKSLSFSLRCGSPELKLIRSVTGCGPTLLPCIFWSEIKFVRYIPTVKTNNKDRMQDDAATSLFRFFCGAMLLFWGVGMMMYCKRQCIDLMVETRRRRPPECGEICNKSVGPIRSCRKKYHLSDTKE